MIVFDSKTGNVKRLIKHLDVPSIQIEPNLIVEEPFVLITYTTGFGEIPTTTQEFLATNSNYMLGVASSGNMNWGDNFAIAGPKIATRYNVPLIHQFNLSGTSKDRRILKEGIEALCRQ